WAILVAPVSSKVTRTYAHTVTLVDADGNPGPSATLIETAVQLAARLASAINDDINVPAFTALAVGDKLYVVNRSAQPFAVAMDVQAVTGSGTGQFGAVTQPNSLTVTLTGTPA